MSEREYMLTVTLKRTFQRKVQSAKHRAEAVGKIARALPDGWAIDKSTIRAGSSKVQKAKTQVKVKARAEVKKADRKEQKLSHIAQSLPLREWVAEVLHREGKSGWTIQKARNMSGTCYYQRRLITLGRTSTAHGDSFNYERLKNWGRKQGIDLSKTNSFTGLFLHELAHACAGPPNRNGDGRTHHGKTFRRHYRRLLKKYAPQVFGLPANDLRTTRMPVQMAANK